MKTVIGVIGSGTDTDKLYETAQSVGKLIALKGSMVACGGLGGVMEGACKGAKSVQGTTIGILPQKDKSAANKYVDICVPTGLGEARNIVLVNTCDAIIALGGGFGTLSEISFALKSGVPLVGLNTWDVSEQIIRCDNAKEAVETAFALAVNSNSEFLRD